MSKLRLFVIVILVIASSLLYPRPAYAYMDPGVTMPIFAILAPIFAMALAALAFMVRPFRRFIMSGINKLRGHPGDEDAETSEQPTADDQEGEGVSRDNADEDAKD